MITFTHIESFYLKHVVSQHKVYAQSPECDCWIGKSAQKTIDKIYNGCELAGGNITDTTSDTCYTSRNESSEPTNDCDGWCHISISCSEDIPDMFDAGWVWRKWGLCTPPKKDSHQHEA